MTTYAIRYARGVKKDFKSIDNATQIRIVKAIQKLAISPRPVGAKKLVGREYYRIRVGDYRVIYDIQDQKLIILVIKIAHRSKVYK